MRALLINPENQTIGEVDVAGADDLESLIGFDTLESDAVGSEGDRLYFDEECFLRGSPGRFQVDTLIPIAGKGVILGTADDGVTLRDAAIGIDELRGRTKFQ
jgi:hypothetical protein